MNIFSRKTLVKNSLINLLGFAVPLAVGLITIPLMVHGFGVERFGLLTLAWAVIGYFSLFDMGLGRAITQLIAERLAHESLENIAKLAWTGLMMMAIFAVIGAAFTASLMPWLIAAVLNVPENLRADTISAFIVLAIAIPSVVLTTGFAGVLAAFHRFDLLNALRIPMGVMIFLIPLAILPYSKDLLDTCLGLIALRVLFLILHIAVCIRVLPTLRTIGVSRTDIKKLLHFGGWLTVSNIIGPLMVYMDRFIIGAMLSTSIVAYYVTPYEMVIRLWTIPAAIVTVLFPIFSTPKGEDIKHITMIYSLGGRAILGVLTPIILVLIVFAEEGLRFWLDDSFSQQSTVVLQYLAIGVYVNSYAQVPFAFIQGQGRADITAKLHLLELPIYLALMFWLLTAFGIVGVAIAWLARIIIDTMLLTGVTHWLARDIQSASKQIIPVLIVPLILFAVSMSLTTMPSKLIFVGISIPALIVSGYFFATLPEEKNKLRNLLIRQVA